MKNRLPLLCGGLSFLLLCPMAAFAQSLDALVAFNRFKATDSTSLLEMHFLASGRQLRYVKAAQGQFQAAVELTVEASDAKGVRAFEKMRVLSAPLANTAGEKSDLQIVKRWVLPDGEYQVKLTTADANHKSTDNEVKIPVTLDASDPNAIRVSDLALLSSYQPATADNDYTRHGFEMTPSLSSFLPAEATRLRFFSEVYDTDKILGAKEPLVLTYGLQAAGARAPLSEYSRHVKKTAAPVLVLLTELDVTTLPSGNYNLFVEVRDKENKVRARQERFVQRSNPVQATPALTDAEATKSSQPTFALKVDTTRLNFYLLSNRPLATTEEVQFANMLLKTGTTLEKQRYLEHFWRKRDPNNPEAKWLEYKKRADYVDKTFRTKAFPGYETDRGRVYLQYGEPNLIHNERIDIVRTSNQNNDVKPYQIWQYYHTESRNQNNVVFVFIQQNLGNNNFRLAHSTARGEVSNTDWRSQIQHKFRDFQGAESTR